MSGDDRIVRRALEAEDVIDVSRELDGRERAARRHTIWALLGVSPVAVIPLVATASEFGVWAFLAAMSVVAARETLLAVRAHRDASELRERLHALTSEWSSSSPD